MKFLSIAFLLALSLQLVSCKNSTTAADPDPATLTWNKLRVGTKWTISGSTIDSTNKGVVTTPESATYEVIADDISIFGKDSVRAYLSAGATDPGHLAYEINGDISLLQSYVDSGVTIPVSWYTFPVKSKGSVTFPSDTAYFPDTGIGLSTFIMSYDGTENLVLAGHTFACIRIKETSTVIDLKAPYERMSGGLMYQWYAPEFGYFVKYTDRDTDYTSTGGIASLHYRNTELVSYSIK